MSLPEFDGDISNWPPFRDSYESLVHKNELNPVDKFAYLRSVLKESSLFAHPRVYRENYTDLRKLVTSLNKIVHSLAVLDIPVNSSNAIFVHVEVDKLNLVTKKHWETQTKDIEDPSFNDFKSFVLGQCQI
ncbi:unnamed protein product [Hermetia illucens]|uniref:Uncharacterized protein n=1 Tax=Hermetia illucens TaxID=343691 RepID=A0A7R8UVF4_HERIL|nr:unnamed protein product [Hermetia illucens]